MSKEVILATETENISLTGNNETYTKTEIDKKIKAAQNSGGVGKLVWSGSCTSDSSVTIPADIDIDYATAYSHQEHTEINGSASKSSNTVKLVCPSSSVDVSFMVGAISISGLSVSFSNTYSGTFSLSTNDDGSHIVKSYVNSSSSRTGATCTIYGYKYF